MVGVTSLDVLVTSLNILETQANGGCDVIRCISDVIKYIRDTGEWWVRRH